MRPTARVLYDNVGPPPPTIIRFDNDLAEADEPDRSGERRKRTPIGNRSRGSRGSAPTSERTSGASIEPKAPPAPRVADRHWLSRVPRSHPGHSAADASWYHGNR